jgi:hypothetical protein
MKKYIFIIFALTSIILSACVSSKDSGADPIPKATPYQTMTSTLVPSSTPLSATSTATQTPSPIPSETPSATYTPVIKITPTPSTKVLDSMESPNGEWTTILEKGTFFDIDNSYVFRAIDTNGEVVWLIEHIVSEDAFVMLPNPFYWTNDGQYLYFLYHGFCDGCMPCGNGFYLHRLNLDTGQVEDLIQESGTWYSMSPDERRVAYISVERGIVIKNLLTGEEIESQFDLSSEYEHIDFSDLTWSPDENSLLALGVIDLCWVPPSPESNDYVIVQLDTHTLEQETIVEPNVTLQRILSWPEMNKALISTNTGDRWLNLETGEIEE